MKKPIYNIYTLTARMVVLSLLTFSSVMAQGASEPTSEPLDPSTFDGIKITLQSPNTSGALVLDRDQTKQYYYDVNAEGIYLHLSNLAQGRHRVVAKVQYGTNEYVLGIFDFIVSADLPEGTDEFEQEIIVVKTVGDGDKSGADATVYAKDGDGNAHVTTPLSIGSGVASSDGAIASGYADGEGATIFADGTGSIASGYAYGEGATIQSSGSGAIASGYADDNASIQASSNGAIASGNADGDNASIQAGGDGAIASGYAGEGASIQANSSGAIASGYADEGATIVADGSGAIASGSVSGEGASIQANSDGAIASGYVSGEGASIQASSDGSIAHGSANGDNASIQASRNGSIASGYADTTNGNVEARGVASQAFGMGTKTQTDGQMVIGKCNVVDTDGDYALIVGNGTSDQNRSNAFAIDWDGNLVLFNAGTPVVLTPAKLATLIA